MERICENEFWNLNLTWYTKDPKFTNCFERTILIWIPCVFLWVFSFVDIYFFRSSKNKDIPWKFCNATKLGITVFLIALAFFELILPLLSKTIIVTVDILTPILKLLTFSLSAFLLIFNKKNGFGSSGLLFMFWFLLVICGIPQLRSEIQRNNYQASVSFHSHVVYFIYYAGAIVMLILNCFADEVPKITKYPGLKKLWPEDRYSFPSRITFVWFNSLIWRGFKHPLNKSDLWELNHEERANEILPCFEKNWKRCSESYHEASYKGVSEEVTLLNCPNKKKKKQASIIPAVIRTFWPMLMCGSIFKFIFDCFLFVNPYILKLLLSFVKKEEERWKGYFYACLLLFASTIQTLIFAQGLNKMFIVGMRIRTALISSIYRKSLRISNAAKKDISTGEIVNLISIDAERFVEFISSVNMLWSAPFQIIIALIFLWKLLGLAVLLGLMVMLVLIPVNLFIGNKMKNLQTLQMKHKDERIKFMNEILVGIKVLKMYAWESSFEKNVQAIRDKEIAILKRIAMLKAATSFIWSCAPFFVSLSSFGTFVLLDKKNVLDVETVFVSLSLFNVLHYPLNMFPTLITQMTQTVVSIKRINKFMNTPELCQKDIKHGLSDSLNSESPISIQDGNFDWFEEPILRDINLRFEKGKLTAVVGAVGSGKSSLLSAILGEMNKTGGKVNILGKVAYVPQQAWILNASLRENILLGKPFDKQLYETVLKICDLFSDIRTFEAKDEIEIGEKGNTLSGGQKQRCRRQPCG
ncbi:multidrug resistance-associated protein 1-like isoform X2 [Agrilus planipennis]|uniref:Multidrug resistance-associated protein 1-like isoform X2 n=1 Tax=Agrilus planipennis TaxID=224129 RepID=A0A1W4XIC4_AGRPL|nr:multidrug resistance-associated protein 1-like isoform X2 [Agrilus planipennis]